MADTVDRAASLSADEAKEPQDDRTVSQDDEPETRNDAPEAPEEEAEEPGGRKETEEPEDARSLTELLEQLGRELSDLGMSEAALEAARNMPEVRRAARDGVAALVAVVAGLAAFAFLNVAAVDGLSMVLATWLAALVLAAVWITVGGVLFFGFMGRARRWLLRILLKAPPTEAMETLERERDDAGKAALGTLERLGPALATQIALAAVPDAGEVAGDVAGSVVEVSDNLLDASDEIVDVITEEIPGGGVVSQVWAVAVRPGRLGIKVATTVLRRGRPAD
jgi:hypothetical protein